MRREEMRRSQFSSRQKGEGGFLISFPSYLLIWRGRVPGG
jgi:hypothetical protein